MTSTFADNRGYLIYARPNKEGLSRGNSERHGNFRYPPTIGVSGRRTGRYIIGPVHVGVCPSPVPDDLNEERFGPADWSQFWCYTRQLISNSL